MAEPWCPQPALERAGVVIEARCFCGFPLGRDGNCPWHGKPRDQHGAIVGAVDGEARAA